MDQFLIAQTLRLKIVGSNETENKSIDSIGYSKVFMNAKSLQDEVNLFSEKLNSMGYLENESPIITKENDSIFIAKLNLNQKTKEIVIYIDKNSILKKHNLFDTKNDSISLSIPEVETCLKRLSSQLEKKGFALSKLKLVNIKKRDKNTLKAELSLVVDKKRQLDGIVIKGYKNFPDGFNNNLKKKFSKQLFNQDMLQKMYMELNRIRFVKQTRYPEILFTSDSTKVYVYLEKAKSNSFDGFIGFSNNDNKKIVFNGYLDLTLNNALNNGEKISIYWKSDGKDQKTFNGSVEIPYVFKSPLGVKAQLNIFRQDSTFQNTKTAADLGYFFSNYSKLYLGYQSTESNDIKNINSSNLSGYKNSFLTSTYEFNNYDADDFLFPEKTNLQFKIGSGTRNAKTQYNHQFFGGLNFKQHLYLNTKNAVLLKSENYYLSSKDYVSNELYRFGGINSVRGFSENSLQANAVSALMTEYQYIISPSIYVHSLFDYAYFQDKASNNSGKLLGVGFGFGLITKNGLFNLVYASGSANDEAIRMSNAIVHVSLKTTF